MAIDHRPQTVRSNHFDFVPPLVEVPRHFGPAGRTKPNGQAAVLVAFQFLIRMKTELGRAVCGFRRKPPDDLSKLEGIIKYTEGPRRILIQRKALFKSKALIKENWFMNAVKAKLSYIPSAQFPGDKIAAISQQQPMWLNNAFRLA